MFLSIFILKHIKFHMTGSFLGFYIFSLFKKQLIDHVKVLLHFFQSGFLRSELSLNSACCRARCWEKHPSFCLFSCNVESSSLLWRSTLVIGKNKTDLIILGLVQDYLKNPSPSEKQQSSLFLDESYLLPTPLQLHNWDLKSEKILRL